MSNGPRYRGKTFHEYMSAKFWHPASKRNIVTVWKRKQQMEVNNLQLVNNLRSFYISRRRSGKQTVAEKKLGGNMKETWSGRQWETKRQNSALPGCTTCPTTSCLEVRCIVRLYIRHLTWIHIQILMRRKTRETDPVWRRKTLKLSLIGRRTRPETRTSTTWARSPLIIIIVIKMINVGAEFHLQSQAFWHRS